MTDRPGYSTAPSGSAGSLLVLGSWLRQVVDVVNSVLRGKTNNVLTITLRAGFATTRVIDARIGGFSALLLQPLTTNAAGALYSATSVLADLTTQKEGEVTFNHANTATVDRTFNLVIIG